MKGLKDLFSKNKKSTNRIETVYENVDTSIDIISQYLHDIEESLLKLKMISRLSDDTYLDSKILYYRERLQSLKAEHELGNFDSKTLLITYELDLNYKLQLSLLLDEIHSLSKKYFYLNSLDFFLEQPLDESNFDLKKKELLESEIEIKSYLNGNDLVDKKLQDKFIDVIWNFLGQEVKLSENLDFYMKLSTKTQLLIQEKFLSELLKRIKDDSYIEEYIKKSNIEQLTFDYDIFSYMVLGKQKVIGEKTESKENQLVVSTGTTGIKNLKLNFNFLRKKRFISPKEIPNNITTVGYRDYADCTTLVEIPDNIAEVGESSFAGCTSLKKISNNLTRVGENTFEGCTSLEEMPDSITEVGESAFAGCTSLKKISNNLTRVGYRAYACCTSLEEMPDSIAKIGISSFIGCTSLKKISNNLTTVNDCAFMHCTSLEKMPDSITEVGESAFYGCTSLKNISDNVTKISDYAFSSCTSLEKIPSGITTIGKGAFRFCTSLEGIPGDITTIGEFAFDQCTSLTNTPWGKMNLKEYKYKTKEVIINYLYLYANSILKEKYHDISEFMENPYIYDLMNSKNIYKNNSIIKFKNLFSKMGKQYNISPQVFLRLSVKATEDFDFNTWNKIKDDFPYDTEEMPKYLMK